MGEQHLDLFALSSRGHVGVGLGNIARLFAGGFVDGTWYFARRGVRAAPGLQLAGVAVVLAGPIEQRRFVVHQRARRGQRLASRADVDVCRMVVTEVVAREGAVLAAGLVEHRDMRLDVPLIDQPGEHLGGAITGVGRQTRGPGVEPVGRARDHRLGRRDLGLPHRGCGFHIHDHRMLQINQIVVGIGVEGGSATGGGPARRRIGR